MAKTVRKTSAAKRTTTKSSTKKTAPKPKRSAPAKAKHSSSKNGSARATNKKTVSSKKSVTEKKTDTHRATTPVRKLTANDPDVVINAKVHYSAKDLEFFRKEILKQREEAKEEFDIISQQLLDTSGEYEQENQSFALHTAEQGSDAMEREKQYLQAQRTSDFIKKLDEALERIDRGVYGICVVCGELIEKQRLLAVPITQKHVSCKNKTQAKRFSVGEYSPMPASEETIE